MGRKKKEITTDERDDVFLYCDTRRCPHENCIRRITCAPFGELIHVRRFDLGRNMECAGYKED